MAGLPTLRINRAPVLTLWAAVVAERLGLPRVLIAQRWKRPAFVSSCGGNERLLFVKPFSTKGRNAL